jgi:hypothetical protein
MWYNVEHKAIIFNYSTLYTKDADAIKYSLSSKYKQYLKEIKVFEALQQGRAMRPVNAHKADHASCDVSYAGHVGRDNCVILDGGRCTIRKVPNGIDQNIQVNIYIYVVCVCVFVCLCV